MIQIPNDVQLPSSFGVKPLILFSGEGESLILASLVAEVNPLIDGVTILSKRGIEWELGEIAKKRWKKRGMQTELNIIIDKELGREDLFCFKHCHFYSLDDDTSLSYCNWECFKWAERRDYTDILMGYRRDDWDRHYKHTAPQMKVLYRETIKKTGGYVPSKRPYNYKVWWFLYYLKERDKKAILKQ